MAYEYKDPPNLKYIGRNKLRLFPYINDKTRVKQLMIDNESYNYISHREVADKISSIIEHHLTKLNLESQKLVITDATAGVGGNTLSFSNYFERVNAIEIDSLRCGFLQNNVNVYGFRNISVYNENCLQILGSLNHDIVFIDPPWGGKCYKKYHKLRLGFSGLPLEKLCNYLLMSNKKSCMPRIIALKLPTNYDLKYLYHEIKSSEIYLYKLFKMDLIIIINTHVE